MKDASGFIMFPLVIHSLDLVVSAIGIMSVGAVAPPTSSKISEDPYAVIKVCFSIPLFRAPFVKTSCLLASFLQWHGPPCFRVQH